MIKKILTGLFLLPIIFANAQENKNKFVVNGNLDVSYGGTNSLRLGGFNIGYFPTDHFSIGLTGRAGSDIFNNSKELSLSNREEEIQKRSDHFAGIFARYNFESKNKFSFFLSLNNVFTWNKQKSESTSEANGIKSRQSIENLSRGYTISLHPGIIYFFHPKFSAEVTLGSVSYSIQKLNETSSYTNLPTTKTVYINDGVSANFFTEGLNLGFSYYFGCKSKDKEQ